MHDAAAASFPPGPWSGGTAFPEGDGDIAARFPGR